MMLKEFKNKTFKPQTLIVLITEFIFSIKGVGDEWSFKKTRVFLNFGRIWLLKDLRTTLEVKSQRVWLKVPNMPFATPKVWFQKVSTCLPLKVIDNSWGGGWGS